jgi:hypothetical protein
MDKYNIPQHNPRWIHSPNLTTSISITIMPSASELRQTAEQSLNPAVPQTYELRDRQQDEQPAHDNRPAEATNAPTNEDYEPNPAASIKLEPERQHILDSIVRLYSGSGKNDDAATGAQDMQVYAKKAIYDDIASCKSADVTQDREIAWCRD